MESAQIRLQQMPALVVLLAAFQLKISQRKMLVKPARLITFY